MGSLSLFLFRQMHSLGVRLIPGTDFIFPQNRRCTVCLLPTKLYYFFLQSHVLIIAHSKSSFQVHVEFFEIKFLLSFLNCALCSILVVFFVAESCVCIERHVCASHGSPTGATWLLFPAGGRTSQAQGFPQGYVYPPPSVSGS